jgi:hypothetical protein
MICTAELETLSSGNPQHHMMGFMPSNPISNHLKLETANSAPCVYLRCVMLRASSDHKEGFIHFNVLEMTL